MGYQSGINNGLQWVPADAARRKSERFKAHLREGGWPGQCRPTVGDDFACDERICVAPWR